MNLKNRLSLSHPLFSLNLTRFTADSSKTTFKVLLNKKNMGPPISEKEINKLTEVISEKLSDYLDVDKKEILGKVVKEAISEIVN